MSVKIYYGMRLTKPRANIFNSVKAIKEVLEPMFYQNFNSLLPSDANTFDIFDKWTHLQKLHESLVRTMDPDDIGYTVVMLRHGLVMVLSDKDSYRRALLDSGIVEDYGYWDNTDRPEDVSPQQWGARTRLWSSALGDFNLTIAESGLSFDHPSSTTTYLKIEEMRRSLS